MLNSKLREVSSLNGKVGYSGITNVIANANLESIRWERLPNTPGWEIDERNLKIMNLTHFHIKSTENLGKNNSSVNIRFVAKTSDISLKSEVATLVRIFEYRKSEAVQDVQNRMSYQQRRHYLATDHEVQSAQNNQRAAWNKSFACRNNATTSAAEFVSNLHKESSRKAASLNRSYSLFYDFFGVLMKCKIIKQNTFTMSMERNPFILKNQTL